MMHFLRKADLADFIDHVLSHDYEQGRAAGAQTAVFHKVGTAKTRGIILHDTPGGYTVWGQGARPLLDSFAMRFRRKRA
jgi:hypothetical protein